MRYLVKKGRSLATNPANLKIDLRSLSFNINCFEYGAKGKPALSGPFAHGPFLAAGLPGQCDR
jgi:hypothetical protein